MLRILVKNGLHKFAIGGRPKEKITRVPTGYVNTLRLGVAN